MGQGDPLKSLIDFHAAKAREPGFDRRISKAWARRWTTTIYRMWFAPASVAAVPENVRKETLAIIFKDGTGNFDILLKSARFPARIAAWWVKKSLQGSKWHKSAEFFFKTFHFMI